jgi:hypothetical protein
MIWKGCKCTKKFNKHNYQGVLWNLLILLETEHNERQISGSPQIDFRHKLRKSLRVHEDIYIYRSCKPNNVCWKPPILAFDEVCQSVYGIQEKVRL